jgi:hypothetical protein
MIPFRTCHKWVVVLTVAGGLASLASAISVTRQSASLQFSASAHSSRKHREQPQVERFDDLVRDDFFAGMMGDTARLDRGMKYCEEILAKNPNHGEALVWHGGGLIARAAQAYRKGDSTLGDSLWNRGLEEMNRAAALEPDSMAIKIGRSATLVGLAQSGWDASNGEARALLLSAVNDYEKVYGRQKPFFRQLGIHSRGELLFGLASGWSILGNQSKARFYLRLVIEHCKGTEYETEARRWLSTKPLTTVQHDCTGCHVS